MVERSAHNRLVAGPIPAGPTHQNFKSGYRIVAIIRPCQGRETGPIPVTRSPIKKQLNSGCFLLSNFVQNAITW